MKTEITKQDLGNDLLFDTLLALHVTFYDMGLKLYKDMPKQRFHYLGKDGKNNYEVDVVPFGPIAEDETVA